MRKQRLRRVTAVSLETGDPGTGTWEHPTSSHHFYCLHVNVLSPLSPHFVFTAPGHFVIMELSRTYLNPVNFLKSRSLDLIDKGNIFSR